MAGPGRRLTLANVNVRRTFATPQKAPILVLRLKGLRASSYFRRFAFRDSSLTASRFRVSVDTRKPPPPCTNRRLSLTFTVEDSRGVFVLLATLPEPPGMAASLGVSFSASRAVLLPASEVGAGELTTSSAGLAKSCSCRYSGGFGCDDELGGIDGTCRCRRSQSWNAVNPLLG